MSVISAQNLGLSFGAFDLFRGISVTIANDAKIGLIGPNGIGKTSVMLIRAGLNQPTTGNIHIARGRRLGYLRQEASDALRKSSGTGAFAQAAIAREERSRSFSKEQPGRSAALATDENTVYVEMLAVFGDLQKQQTRLHMLEAEMSGGCYNEEGLVTYGGPP